MIIVRDVPDGAGFANVFPLAGEQKEEAGDEETGGKTLMRSRA